jgi:hypothetical protein
MREAFAGNERRQRSLGARKPEVTQATFSDYSAREKRPKKQNSKHGFLMQALASPTDARNWFAIAPDKVNDETDESEVARYSEARGEHKTQIAFSHLEKGKYERRTDQEQKH